jgi:hypothetical protein
MAAERDQRPCARSHAGASASSDQARWPREERSNCRVCLLSRAKQEINGHCFSVTLLHPALLREWSSASDGALAFSIRGAYSF